MRRLPFTLCLVCLVLSLVPADAARAEQERKFHFGLESRISEAAEFERSEVNWGVIPNFSYQLTDRFRLDAFAGVAYSDEAGLYLSLQPGFRYYLGPPRGKLRFNTGMSVGFTLIDQDDQVTTEGGADFLASRPESDEGVWLRAVPLEVEYWSRERWGLTMALDYQSRLGGSRGIDDEGFGLAAGFRFKIR